MSDKSPSINTLNADMRLPWMITVGMASSLLIYLLIAKVYADKLPVELLLVEDARVSLRTIFYWLAILTLPFTNLLRHIQLRLNQTMPTATPPQSRYVLTVMISMLLCDTIAWYGLYLFFTGDGLNSLLIFTGLSLLGMFLYRPKLAEYQSIVEALENQKDLEA
jgi:hypothetical protein